MVSKGEAERPKPKRRRLRRDLPPQDLAVKRMLFEKKRRDKIDYRKQLLREWKLGQAQNLHDTYTSLVVPPRELAPAHIRAERDQVHRLLQQHGALRPNFIPN